MPIDCKSEPPAQPVGQRGTTYQAKVALQNLTFFAGVQWY